MNSNLKFTNVKKTFKDFTLGPISFELEKGKVLALVGPNGSGKTTTLDCVSGMMQQDSGKIEVCGYENNPNEVQWKNLFGYVTSEPVLIKTMTGTEFLKYIAQYYKSWDFNRMNSLISRLEFPEELKIHKLSTGNKTKLEIISALSMNPRLLLLDEPTNALDPIVRDVFLDIIFEFMTNEENSIIWSTHIITEVGSIADEFAFLIDGLIREISSKIDLTENWRRIIVHEELNKKIIPGVCEIIQADNSFEICTWNYPATIEYLKKSNIEILNEYYMNIENICIKNLQRYKTELY
jgi:ABC-2 type transport system ATP-binding protein